MRTTKWNAKELAIPSNAAANPLAKSASDAKELSELSCGPYHGTVDPEGDYGYNHHPGDLSRDVDAALFFFTRGHH